MTARPTGGVPLGALLRSTGWADVVHLAGEVDAAVLAGSAVVRGPADPLPDVPGSLVVVLGSADRSDWRIDSLVNRAHSARAAAVMLDGHDRLRRSTEVLAQRLALPVLGALNPVAAHEFLTRTLREPASVTAELVLRAAAAGHRAGEDVDSVLARLAEALRRPVGLVTANAEVTAGALALSADEQAALGEGLSATAAQVPAPVAIDVPGSDALVAHPVAATGVTTWLASRTPSGLTAERQAVEAALRIGAVWVEQRLALLRLTLERSARRRTSLLGELLQGEPGPGTLRRALDIGWRLDGWHTGVRIGVSPDVDVAGRRGDVVAAFEEEGLHPVVVEQGDGWSAWLTADSAPTAQQVQDVASRVRRVQRRLVGSLDPYVGVGRVHAGAAAIATTLAEAGDASRLAQSRVTSERFVHVDRLGLAQLLLAWTRTDTFQPAARKLLEPLRAQPGDLVQTLATFLDTESSVAHAADILGVHRNTVAARVARIRDMLGVDLDDPDERLALHLACRTELMLRRRDWAR